LRWVSLNLDSLAIEINESKEVTLFQSILEHGIDILLLQELGLHWSNLSRTKQWRSRVERFLNPKCTRTRCSHNIHDSTGAWVQASGTGIPSHDKVSRFAMGSGCNTAKLGRWTWSQFRGEGGVVLRAASVCQTCASSGGERTVWSQHKACFNNHNNDWDPRDAFMEDLAAEIQEWTQEGDQVMLQQGET